MDKLEGALLDAAVEDVFAKREVYHDRLKSVSTKRKANKAECLAEDKKRVDLIEKVRCEVESHALALVDVFVGRIERERATGVFKRRRRTRYSRRR